MFLFFSQITIKKNEACVKIYAWIFHPKELFFEMVLSALSAIHLNP